jgi:hypothetical protein
MSLAPVPSEQPGGSPSCANCSAPLAPDQRYCLACGQPVSPVRLAFLDVLQAETQPSYAGQGPVGALPPGYASVIEPVSGPYAWLRRYSGLFGLLSVLLLAVVVGLLVGHWVTQSKAPSSPQVIKVEGLSGTTNTPLASAGTGTTPTTSTTPAATTTGKSSSSAKSEEAKEKAEAKAEEKAEEKAPAKAPEAKKISPTAVGKLEKTTGKAHEKELNKISTAPIEVK